MRVKVSDYIVQFLAEQGVTHNFTIPGGGAMHLNDAFAQNPHIQCIYVQHEQAAAMAAEGYVRVCGKLPVVCCTTGPGGTNTLTGVLGAWLDSVPMLVVSGQVKSFNTVEYVGLPLRAVGDQEFPIVPVVKEMTKYAHMIMDVKMVKYHLQKALWLATTGRPGPVWLDVPLDIQGAYLDDSEFVEFSPEQERTGAISEENKRKLSQVIEKLKSAKRPVLNVGNGIRIANAYEELQQVIEILKIPVVTGFHSIDAVTDDNPYYAGRAGLMGDRTGNFAVQNSDVLLSVGSRLAIRRVGYDVKKWARESFVINVDIDDSELKKPTIHVELPIQMDIKIFLNALLDALKGEALPEYSEWNESCQRWRKKYPVVTQQHRDWVGLTNPYYYMDCLTRRLPEGQITVSGNGASCVISSQAYVIKKDQKYIMNNGASSMGYDLPAAIGASLAANKAPIICLSGDGSIQMNLQELQTIVFHQLPIKIFLINNNGYHSMRQTEQNIFKDHKRFGIGPESGDLSFPQMERIANAYGIPYVSCHSNEEVDAMLEAGLGNEGPVLCEIFTTTEQKYEPKSATKQLPDGSFISPPLEDLAPFLPREELREIMKIPMLEEN